MNKKKIIRIVIAVVVLLLLLVILYFAFYYPNKVFKDNEKKFIAAGERYYQINKNYLPSQEGRVLSVNLGTLIKEDYLDDLYIPYSKKVCDLNESTVKAVKKDGEFQFYTYLKCGSYESSTDHEGPVITLSGDTTIKLNKGDKYNEPGVKSVIDDTDGNIDVSKVTIKGEVNTDVVGTYEVTYTISDSLNNKSEVKRKVVVEESFSNVVKEATKDTNGYYRGENVNNYVMFNNMLFRIVKVNSDGSVVIVSNDALANVDYTNNGRFVDSSLDKWLNDYFYNLLEPRYQKLIKSSNWCDDVISSDNISTKECTRKTSKRKVGILSIQDYNLSYDGVSSYLDKTNLSWYSNLASDDTAWAITNVSIYPGSLVASDKTNLLNVVPAVTLKDDITLLEGDGTYTNPYMVLKSNKGRRSSSLNEREIGEYVTYSGYTFRISNILEDGTTEVIMNSVLKSDNQQVNISYTNKQKAKVYNPNQEGNIGYKIKNNMTRYIDTKLFVSKKISVPIYEGRITYQGKHDTKKYKLLISIPSTFDIFSARVLDTNDSGYWLIDSSRSANTKAAVRSSGTLTYSETSASDSLTAGVKVKAYFDKDVIIEGGSGTISEPYTLID